MRSIFEAFSYFENKVKISFAVRFAVDMTVSIIIASPFFIISRLGVRLMQI